MARVLLVATVAIPRMCEGCPFYKMAGCGSAFWGRNLAECPSRKAGGGPFQCPGGKCYDCDQCRSVKP